MRHALMMITGMNTKNKFIEYINKSIKHPGKKYDHDPNPAHDAYGIAYDYVMYCQLADKLNKLISLISLEKIDKFIVTEPFAINLNTELTLEKLFRIPIVRAKTCRRVTPISQNRIAQNLFLGPIVCILLHHVHSVTLDTMTHSSALDTNVILNIRGLLRNLLFRSHDTKKNICYKKCHKKCYEKCYKECVTLTSVLCHILYCQT